MLERFIQLDNTKKVIFVDDIDMSRLNFTYKSMLLSRLENIYPKIIITARDNFQLEEIVHEESGHVSVLNQYMRYEILKFGHLLRSKLIDKWNMLGREDTLEMHEPR
jgi:hypothetical protein